MSPMLRVISTFVTPWNRRPGLHLIARQWLATFSSALVSGNVFFWLLLPPKKIFNKCFEALKNPTSSNTYHNVINYTHMYTYIHKVKYIHFDSIYKILMILFVIKYINTQYYIFWSTLSKKWPCICLSHLWNHFSFSVLLFSSN